MISPDGEDDLAFGVGGSAGSLDDGDSITFGPRRLEMPFVAGQAFYVGVLADADDTVDEGDASNNTLVTSAPITIVPYFAGFDEQLDIETGSSVTVSVRKWLGVEASEAVLGAAVTLIIERPIAENNEPSVPAGFEELSGTTNTDANVVFALPAGFPWNDDRAYRYVATVTIAGVATPLKFQSCLRCEILR